MNCSPSSVSEHSEKPVWSPDQRDGTFCNPVIDADYSDPDVIRDGRDFFMTASSFNCTPGLPILHSTDLVNWTLINHALRALPHERYRQMQPGCGVWAPAIRKHAGKFWIFFPMPDEGIYVTTADHPRGQWSEPWLLQEGKGLIDPCPLWDEDGRAYLVYAWARSRSGIKHRLSVAEMSPDGLRLISESRTVFEDAERHPTLEGPKFLKRNSYYYISAPAGGVATGWQVILRSRHVFGPYEDKIVLAQGKTPINGPHQGALVDTPDGKWWFVHFQDAGIYGRVVHLQPARWENDWPVIGVNQDHDGVGEPVLRYAKPVQNGLICQPQTSDEFDRPTLGLQWQWQANHETSWWSLTERPGHLRLRAAAAEPKLSTSAALLLQKFPAKCFVAETSIEISDDLAGEAGLIIAGRSSAAIVISQKSGARQVKLLVDDEIAATTTIAGRSVRLRVHVAEGGLCRFAYATMQGDWIHVGQPYQASEGHWIGAKVGLFCRGENGHADVDYVRVSKD